MVRSSENEKPETYYQQYVTDLHEALLNVPEDKVEKALDLIYGAHREERDVYVIGNGGSASTASHMACDLGKGACVPGKRRLRITSLNDNVAHFSALANDISYDAVFVEQLRNLIRPGDVLVGISASGNSANVVNAFEFARSIGAKTIGLLGFTGGAMKELSDVPIHVRSAEYGPVEDAHLIINHIWTVQLRERIEQEELVARW